jgi:hypothetical protein
MEEFDVTAWMVKAAISIGGQKKLEVAEIKDELSIELLDEVTLASIKLAPGDAIKFRKAQSTWLKAKDVIPTLETDNPTLQEAKDKANGVNPGLYTLEQFAKFLAGKPDIEQKSTKASGFMFGGVKLPSPSVKILPDNGEYGPRSDQVQGTPLQQPPSDLASLSRNLMRDILCIDDCTTNSRGEKPLLPVNFVSTPRGIIIDHDQVVTADKDGKLLIKPNKHKPTADKLTVGQWVGANSRILSKLIPKLSAQDLMDYLDYCRKIGDLLNQFTTSSVFILDNDHRIEVNQTAGKRWNDIDSHLEIYTLRRKDEHVHGSNSSYSPASVGGGQNRNNSRRPQSQGGNQNRPKLAGGLCWDFNSLEGCFYGDKCRYIHAESASNPQRAPRFQTQTSGSRQIQP